MGSTIDFYYDILSPYAYLAHTQLPSLAERHGASIAYHAIDLEQAKRLVGNTGPANREMPIKHRYLRTDLQRWASRYAVALEPPSGYGSARLNCGAFYAADRGTEWRYIDAAWQRVWGEGEAMNDDALLAGLAAHMDWPVDEFMAYVSSAAATDRLHQSTVEATRRGVFGVPVMRIDKDLWWGNDRLEFLENHLQSRRLAPIGTKGIL